MLFTDSTFDYTRSYCSHSSAIVACISLCCCYDVVLRDVVVIFVITVLLLQFQLCLKFLKQALLLTIERQQIFKTMSSQITCTHRVERVTSAPIALRR